MFLSRPDGSLFSRFNLGEVFRARRIEMQSEIARANAASLDEATAIELYRIEPLALCVPYLVSTEETTREIPAFGERSRVAATAFTFGVPFTGDPTLLHCIPSNRTMSLPRGRLEGTELRLTFVTTQPDTAAIRSALDAELEEINRWKGWINASVEAYNEVLRIAAKSAVESRSARQAKAASIAVELGYPGA